MAKSWRVGRASVVGDTSRRDRIATIIRQVLAFMEKETERRSIAVSIATRGIIPKFESDRGNLQQIFLNLINNAFAAVDDKGRIGITVRGTASEPVTISTS